MKSNLKFKDNMVNGILIMILLYFFNPNNYGFVFGYSLFFYFLLKTNLSYKITTPISITLLIFSLSYACFYYFAPELGSQFILIYALIPYTFFTAGRIISHQETSKIKFILFISGLCLAIPSMLSVLLSIIDKGFITLERDVTNVWTGQKEPATNTAGLLILNMTIPALFMMKKKLFKQILFNVLAIAVFILSLICILRLGSRTHIVITLVSILISLIFKLSKQSALKNFMYLFILFIIGNITAAYLDINLDSEIFSAYADRMDSKSHGAATAGGRTWKWEKSLELMIEKPLGWNINEIGLAHNLWFDVARAGGLISFIFLFIFSLKTFQKTITISFTKVLDDKVLAGMLLVYVVALNLLFFVEPIMEGYFNCFAIFCFISGIVVELARIQIEKTAQNNV